MGNRYDVISITMDTETKRRIDVLAEQDDRTRSNMLAWLVNQEYLRRAASAPVEKAAKKADGGEITQQQEATNEVDKSKS